MEAQIESELCPLRGSLPCAEERCKWWVYVGSIPTDDSGVRLRPVYNCAIVQLASGVAEL